MFADFKRKVSSPQPQIRILFMTFGQRRAEHRGNRAYTLLISALERIVHELKKFRFLKSLLTKVIYCKNHEYLPFKPKL